MKNGARMFRTPFYSRTVFLGGETVGPPHVAADAWWLGRIGSDAVAA
jgi:hypothetical protein